MTTDDGFEPAVHVVGAVTATDREYAVGKLRHVVRTCPGPVRFARLELRQERDPARARPSVAKATVDADGRVLRAHVAASTMHEAADLLEGRLRRVVDRAVHHDRDAHLRHRDPVAWQHGDPPARRPAHHPRPVDEREVVVRKSYGLAAQSIDEAVDDLERLDHDFFLFRDVTDAVDCVVHRVADGYELWCAGPVPDEVIAAPVRVRTDPVPVGSMSEATALLDASDAPFVFFVDPGSGRGCVCYRRYDGHYGLVVGADAPTPA
jgi:ribosome-associated translation inhibitor RaiA